MMLDWESEENVFGNGVKNEATPSNDTCNWNGYIGSFKLLETEKSTEKAATAKHQASKNTNSAEKDASIDKTFQDTASHTFSETTWNSVDAAADYEADSIQAKSKGNEQQMRALATALKRYMYQPEQDDRNKPEGYNEPTAPTPQKTLGFQVAACPVIGCCSFFNCSLFLAHYMERHYAETLLKQLPSFLPIFDNRHPCVIELNLRELKSQQNRLLAVLGFECKNSPQYTNTLLPQSMKQYEHMTLVTVTACCIQRQYIEACKLKHNPLGTREVPRRIFVLWVSSPTPMAPISMRCVISGTNGHGDTDAGGAQYSSLTKSLQLHSMWQTQNASDIAEGNMACSMFCMMNGLLKGFGGGTGKINVKLYVVEH